MHVDMQLREHFNYTIMGPTNKKNIYNLYREYLFTD